MNPASRSPEDHTNSDGTTNAPARHAPRVRTSVRSRILSFLVGVGLASPLVLAAVLQPSTRGFGTHEQLGLPPCGWVLAFGKPCMTCCMTTAFSHMAHGHFWQAWVTQPAGAALSLVAAAGFWAGMHGAVFGSRMGWLCSKLFTGKIMWPGLVLLLGAWAYKVVTWPT